MKKIPIVNVFNKQEIGGNWDNIEECLQYAALYMHTWNLLEWIMANIIAADTRVNGNRSVEEIWMIDLKDKCAEVKKIYSPQDAISTLVQNIQDKKDSCRALRDTISHSHARWATDIGAYQQQNGWFRLKRNERHKLNLEKDDDATEEWKTTLSNYNNPEITTDVINTPIYTTYGKSEIVAELKTLMGYIRLFDYDPLSDHVVNHYHQTLEEPL